MGEKLRVVDLDGSVASGYAGRLFADCGAEVIDVEPPEGAATRRLEPLVSSTGRSAMHGYLSAGKFSVSLACRDQALSGADLALIGGEASGEGLPDSVSTCSITWFGRSGRYAGYHGSDAVVQALSGMMRNIGPAEGPPLIPTGYHAQLIGGLTAFIGALGHLAARPLGNADKPFHLETSIFEAYVCFTEVGAVSSFNTGATGARLGINRFPPTYPLGVFPCRDGWLGVTVLTPAQWTAFCRLLELEFLLENPDYQSTLNRLHDAGYLEPIIRRKLLEHSAEALFYAGQRARVPLARVPTMMELFDVDQFREREAFVEITEGDTTYLAPGIPFRPQGSPSMPRRNVPAPGEHDGRIGKRGSVLRPEVAMGKEPLAGVRIVDLSMGWAGPLATRHLADLGADVIKVESCERFDWWRSWEATPEWIASDGAEKAIPYLVMNRGKRDVTLDLEDPEGRELLLRLVAESDVLVENFSGGVLPKLGLGYADLRRANPELVMVSMPAFGASGPWHTFRAYGSTVEHASGLPHLTGRADDPPVMHHVAYGDAVAGLNGAAAVLSALHHRTLTGAGQLVDLSQVECLLPLAAHGILAQSANGQVPPRRGNERVDAAPHGVYPAAGDDEWLLIQIFDEQAWESLKAIAELEDFGGLDNRLARRSELDAAVASWTRNHDAGDLMRALQERGIVAARLQYAADLLHDPHLQDRAFWQTLERAHVGRQPHPSAPYRRGDGPIPIRAPAPTLGQHNIEILGAMLGLGETAIGALKDRGVIGTRPRIRSEPSSSQAGR